MADVTDDRTADDLDPVEAPDADARDTGPDPDPALAEVDPDAVEEVELRPAEARAVQRRAERGRGERHVRVRGGTPVTSIGGPEDLDVRDHPRATIVGVVALAVLFLIASFAVGTSLRDGERSATVERVSVPKLDGVTLEAASRTLDELGILVAVEYQPNEAIPEGVVFGQRPVAGSKLEVGTEVTLIVSDGPAGLRVPDVKGFQGAEAVKLLQATGFAPTVQPAHDEVVRPGEVLRTDPAAGTRAGFGTPIAVIVSDGPAPHVVPGVVDQPVAQGFAALGRAGVGLGTVTTQVVAGKPPGVIVSTDPPAGASIPRDYPVNAVVTEAAPSLTVPSVTGLLQATATKALSSSQLAVSVRNQSVAFDDARAGRVIAQSIPPGTPVSIGTPLQLTVAVAAPPPTTTTVPQAPTTTVP
ncbi:Stk1 family PASTA domain-containing Ser/Thr kinase [Dermatobacter hominis]|uniref:Stk1 family PASTA domain-containing Ser/Thr kinase n=1 Tax=Dermatobacter hominis TaxID=2884263 RepID=UPI001D108288|nr:Stk1 family PASTA domain-containing Ser/Thr kinase [Dermatobacter hominis]UDY34243.1 PASTA domain-containing protein [Dermatobacter hominis]